MKNVSVTHTVLIHKKQNLKTKTSRFQQPEIGFKPISNLHEHTARPIW